MALITAPTKMYTHDTLLKYVQCILDYVYNLRRLNCFILGVAREEILF